MPKIKTFVFHGDDINESTIDEVINAFLEKTKGKFISISTNLATRENLPSYFIVTITYGV
jgi:hypothetical protein